MKEERIQELLQKPQPITVCELCAEKFNLIIPSYQRGYRWTEKEIVRLIKDVLAYNSTKDGEFYCLQPLVVRHILVNGKHQWRVIDGQQRLTTIYLLLKLLDSSEDCYSLEYDRENILAKMFENTGQFDKEENCEVFHLAKARKVIEDFFKLEKDALEKKNLLQENILSHCSFILYVMKEDKEKSLKDIDKMEHDLFNNLNSGKISLTESELVKALFLHNVGETKLVKEVKQISMSEKLDTMERTLREDEMWYFLAGDKSKPSSCIDYLYRVWYLAEHETLPADIDYPIFSSMEEKISSDSQMRQKWEEIKKCFYTITGWYSDPLLYNLIGYLEGRKVSKKNYQNNPPFNEHLLAELYRHATSAQANGCLPSKKAFIQYVKDLCLNSIPPPNILTYVSIRTNMMFLMSCFLSMSQ